MQVTQFRISVLIRVHLRVCLYIERAAGVWVYTFNGLPHVALRCAERKSARSPGHQDRENFSPRLGQLREYQQTFRVSPLSFANVAIKPRNSPNRTNTRSPFNVFSVELWDIQSRGYENRCSVSDTMPNMLCHWGRTFFPIRSVSIVTLYYRSRFNVRKFACRTNVILTRSSTIHPYPFVAIAGDAVCFLSPLKCFA